MGRGKIEIKRIENVTNRQVTFSKRRGGLLKKARELSILCEAQLGVIIFSTSGKMFEYCTEPYSMRHIIDRYQKISGNVIQEYDNQQFYCELTRMKNEYDKLQESMRHFSGEDLTSLPLNDLHQLEQQLEISANRVRARKNQLLHQQLENLRRKEHILEEQNNQMYQMLAENQAAMEKKVIVEQSMIEHFGQYYQEEQARNMLHLAPLSPAFRLQPTQPNLQEASIQRYGLQLWY